MTHKLSVHAGSKPTGLTEFLNAARPAVLYLLNNTVANPYGITIRRVQNDVWDRLPDAMNNPNYFKPVDQGGVDPVASARFELTAKTIFVPKHGNLNLIDYWQLGPADYYAPYNEPVFGEPTADNTDCFAKAQWLNDYTCEALRIAHESGLKLCIFSFASRNPHPSTWPYLHEAALLAYENDGLIDLHAYNTTDEPDAPLASAQSGALFYREFYAAIQPSPAIVLSEASSGNGYNTGLSGQAWINDMLQCAIEWERDWYILGSCGFQLDQGAESCIDYNTLIEYGNQAAQLVVPPQPPAQTSTIITITPAIDPAIGVQIVPMLQGVRPMLGLPIGHSATVTNQ